MLWATRKKAKASILILGTKTAVQTGNYFKIWPIKEFIFLYREPAQPYAAIKGNRLQGMAPLFRGGEKGLSIIADMH